MNWIAESAQQGMVQAHWLKGLIENAYRRIKADSDSGMDAWCCLAPFLLIEDVYDSIRKIIDLEESIAGYALYPILDILMEAHELTFSSDPPPVPKIDQKTTLLDLISHSESISVGNIRSFFPLGARLDYGVHYTPQLYSALTLALADEDHEGYVDEDLDFALECRLLQLVMAVKDSAAPPSHL